jgi:hypothetical protein
VGEIGKGARGGDVLADGRHVPIPWVSTADPSMELLPRDLRPWSPRPDFGRLRLVTIDLQPRNEQDPVQQSVTRSFHLSGSFGAQLAEVAGDFTAWAPLAMIRDTSGGFHLSLRLEPGRSWRYRFLLDGEHWINDPNAPSFVTGPNGTPASVITT